MPRLLLATHMALVGKCDLFFARESWQAHAIYPSFTSENKRVKGIEPSCAAWEAAVLPLNYTRVLEEVNGDC